MRSMFILLAAGLAVLCLPAFADPVTTAFVYQAQLADGGAPANGTFDLKFRLFDAAGAGAQVGPDLCVNDVTVSNGLCTVTLDFGSVFTGARRFLEIEVRPDTGLDCASAAGFVPLSPRQELTATPHAALALNASLLNGQPPAFYNNAANMSGVLAIARGGTGLSAAGAPGTFLRSSGAALSFGTIGAADLPALGGDVTGSYSASTVVSLQNRSVSAAPPAFGQVLKWDGSRWTPSPDLDSDTNTTYSAGAGLALTGTVFSVATGGVTGAMMMDSTVAAADLASDAGSLAKVSGAALSISAGNVIATGNATADEFLYSVPMTSSYIVNECSFVERNGLGVQCGLGNGGAVPVSNSSFGLHAPVNLPDRATITAVTFYVLDNDAAIDFSSLRLLRHSRTGGYTNWASTSSTGANAAVQSLTVSGLSWFVDNSVGSLEVGASTSATWPGLSTTLRVMTVRIDYTLTRPAR